MGTIQQKLDYLDNTKTLIKTAIVNKGVAVASDTTFRAYAEKISQILGKSEAIQKLQTVIENYRQNNVITKIKETVLQAEGYILDNVYMFGELEQESYSGTNLFNKNDVEEGYIYNGSISSNTVWTNSGFIEVTAGTTIIWGTTDGTKGGLEINEYDENKSYVASTWAQYNSTSSATRILSATTKYVRVGYRHDAFDVETLQLNIGTEFAEYEKYVGGTASPNPDYPSDIEVVGNNANLFDKDNANILNAYFSSSTSQITSNASNRTLYIKCEPNTDYSIRKINSSQFVVGYTHELPQIGSDVYGISAATTQIDSNYKYISLKTDSDAQYIVVRFMQTAQDTLTLEELLDTIKIEKGTTSTSYTDYNCGGIDFTMASKNLYDATTDEYTADGLSNSADSSVLKVNGNVASYSRREFNSKILNAGTYSINLNLKSGSITSTSSGGLFYIYKAGTSQPVSSNIALTDTNKNGSRSFTLEEDTNITIGLYARPAETFSDAEIEYQIVSGEDADYDFEEYTCKQATIQLPENEFMAKIGDFEDYIDNAGLLHKYIVKITLTADNAWNSAGVANTFYATAIKNYATRGNKPYSMYFNGVENVDSAGGITADNAIAFNANHVYYRFYIKSSEFSTVAELKEWLAENPLTVYYVLEEPYTVELDADEKQKYLTLLLNNGTNNITCSAPLSARYSKSVDEILEEIEAMFESEVG